MKQFRNPISTLKRIQDNIFIALEQYPDGLKKEGLKKAVLAMRVIRPEKGENWDTQFSNAILGLVMRGIIYREKGRYRKCKQPN